MLNKLRMKREREGERVKKIIIKKSTFQVLIKLYTLLTIFFPVSIPFDIVYHAFYMEMKSNRFQREKNYFSVYTLLK